MMIHICYTNLIYQVIISKCNVSNALDISKNKETSDFMFFLYRPCLKLYCQIILL